MSSDIHRPSVGVAATSDAVGGSQVWTVAAIRALGATTDVQTAGAILGVGRTKAYELAKAGEFPVRTIRVGRRYLVPIPALLALLGAD